jgi:cyclopropane fatty-acyl-phospholipid synthase-like methyltransferase
MTPDFFVPPDWYQTFFTTPVMRFWEAAVPADATEAEVAFVARHVGVQPPATILDVPCGSGRHSVALAKAGFTAVGIDSSEAALRRAEALAREQKTAVRFMGSDMLEFDVGYQSDALICMGNSIGYFEPALTQKLLARFAAALRPGGRLIIDTSICAESLLPIATERSLSFPGGTYVTELAYDAAHSILKTRAQLTIDGEVHELRYRHFVMTSGELVRSLNSTGFDICSLYRDTQDAAFGPGSPRLLLVAELGSINPP